MDCTISDKCAAYQFILAIQNTYPDYARVRREDLRRNRTPTIDQMCDDLTDEARRDDPIKTTYAMSKQRKSGGEQSRGDPNRRRRGKRNDNSDSKCEVSDNQKTAQSNRPQRAYCKHCKSEHIGGGDNCWFTFPHKASEEWRARNANSIKTNNNQAANAAIVNNDVRPYSGFSLATVQLSDNVMRMAQQIGYKHRFIFDTGSTDHVCNDYGKFVSFDSNPNYRAVITTGAGPICINKKGTIQLTVATSDGSLHDIRFTDVLYAPDMFTSVFSHSALKRKDVYYHGWQNVLHLMPGEREIAYTPTIDGIPTLLLANDELEAAEAFAFAAVHNTKRSSVLTPTREVSLCDLHEIFGHANPRHCIRWLNPRPACDLSTPNPSPVRSVCLTSHKSGSPDVNQTAPRDSSTASMSTLLDPSARQESMVRSIGLFTPMTLAAIDGLTS
jgi:hypothetical protein